MMSEETRRLERKPRLLGGEPLDLSRRLLVSMMLSSDDPARPAVRAGGIVDFPPVVIDALESALQETAVNWEGAKGSASYEPTYMAYLFTVSVQPTELEMFPSTLPRTLSARLEHGTMR